jgi:hypothetical protein
VRDFLRRRGISAVIPQLRTEKRPRLMDRDLFATGLRRGWRMWRKLLIAFTDLGVETNP